MSTARARDGERVELPDEGVAIVPLADLRLLEEIEDREDADEARRRLAEDPRPPDCKKLAGPGDLYRVRFGDWRIVYTVEDVRLVVLVCRPGRPPQRRLPRPLTPAQATFGAPGGSPAAPPYPSLGCPAAVSGAL